jgi:hypothetical protein
MARDDDLPRHGDPTELEPRPQPPPAPRGGAGATVEQLRGDIDSGATGDKVPVLDPAAAPLGTDAEAAGVPVRPATVVTVREAERTVPNPSPHPHDEGGAQRGRWLLGGLILAVALAAVALWLSFR